MYSLQVFDPQDGPAGWQFVQTVWETEVGLVYFLTNDPRGYTSLDEAKAIASDLSSVCAAVVGVFDAKAGALVFQAKP